MTGTLYLVATPIGNLEDITFRAVRTLREVDLIAAEDTRNTIKLLNHFDIHTPMTSYHEHNKYDKADELIEKLQNGTSIAVVTDAGTPGISDPGEVLVKKAHEAGIPVMPIPGAAACIAAVTTSGQPCRRFAFEAFLPPRDTQKKERKRILEELRNETRTIVLYEAPHRLKATLEELYETLGDRNLSIARELTKQHEETTVTTLSAAIRKYETTEPRGEYVLVIAGKTREEVEDEKKRQWETMSVSEHLSYYETQGMSEKDAMKAVARDRGVSKRDIYREIHIEM